MFEDPNVDLPDWARWVAQDADGVWRGYACEPLQRDHGWYENEIGLYQKPLATDANRQ
ncbi:MAG TPA: hypothetical protein VIM41_07200 [Gammaproteobacteria bacterium]